MQDLIPGCQKSRKIKFWESNATDENPEVNFTNGIYVNDKRVLRICRAKDIRYTVKYNNRGCTRRAKNPQYLAENLLNHQFYAEKPNEKWLTDVTEFKWYDGMEVHKYEVTKTEIPAIYHENKGRYGYRRITTALHNKGIHLNHKTVQRLNERAGLSFPCPNQEISFLQGGSGKDCI